MGLRVTCKHCGGSHPAYECRKKSTATGKDRLTRVGSQETDRSGSRPGLVEARLPQHATEKPQAGTQALPVDTNSANHDSVATPSTRFMEVASTSAGTVGNEDRQTILNAAVAGLPASIDGAGSSPGGSEVRHLAADTNTKRGRGRPKTITDMKVYKAMKQREYRARKKNAE